MEAEIRRSTRGKRKPLADCTNTIASRTSTSVVRPPKPSVSSAFKKLLTSAASTTTTNNNNDSGTSGKSDISSGSTGNRGGKDYGSNVRGSDLLRLASTPSRLHRSTSSDGSRNEPEIFEPCSVYSRRPSADKRKTKEKAIAVPVSSSDPSAKIKSVREKMNKDGDISLSKSMPHRKKRCCIPTGGDDPELALPQDFIEKQKAYFAEIDAFELSEEEVASVNELD